MYIRCIVKRAGNYIRGDALLREGRDALLRQGITRGCIVKSAGNYIRGDALLRGQGITYEGMHC